MSLSYWVYPDTGIIKNKATTQNAAIWLNLEVILANDLSFMFFLKFFNNKNSINFIVTSLLGYRTIKDIIIAFKNKFNSDI